MDKLLRYSILFLFILCSCTVDRDRNNESHLLELIVTEGTNMAVAVSPDKRTLAMAHQGTIRTLPIEGGEAVAITDAMGDAQEPAWSPGGDRIAFHSYRNGNYHIWTVNRDGSDLQQITEGIYDDREPHWSPDGRSIVFSSDRSGTYDLWQVDLATGELEQLTSHEANDYNPAFSPDGNRIAFVSRREEPGIYLLENGEATLAAPSSLSLAAPSWSEDGSRLLYTAYDGSVASYLYLTDPDGGSLEKISAGDEDFFPFRASWISDHTFVYTADGVIKKRSLENQLTGRQQQEIIPFEATLTLDRSPYEKRVYDFDDRQERTPLGIVGPVVSPDGNRVAFTALGDIYIQNTDGELIRITNDRYVNLDPDWSPDGNSLAYISDRRGRMEIWIHNLQTGNERLLTRRFEEENEEAAMPSWSPDGRHIAFYTVDYRKKWGSGNLKIANVATGNVEQDYGSFYNPGKADWSPDGNTLALMVLNRHSTRFREGFNHFLLVSVNNGSVRYVTPHPDDALSVRNQNGPVWSPDGSKMAYVKDGVLWTVPVDSDGEIAGEPVQITEELADNISWTGDSKSLVYIATDRLKKINVETGSSEEIPIELTWAPRVPDEDYIIHAGKLFNGVDSTYMENVDILIRENRISEITPHQEHADITVIDASDQVVMPGLFEMHSHQSSSAGVRLGKIWLSYGLTSVRDPGSDPYDSLERKESWSSDTRPGPRLFFTGGLTDGNRIYYGLANSVTEENHIRMELQRAQRLGYNLIKTYVRMPDEIQKVITEAAHEMGIPVSSHELYPAAKYNVDSIEHFRATSRRGYSLKESALTKRYDDVMQLFSRSGITITPTMAISGRGFWKMASEFDEVLNDERIRAFHSESYIEGVAGGEFTPEHRLRLKALQGSLLTIVNSGGIITAGTDSPLVFPYGVSLHTELWTYVDGGLSPFQALQTATINAAEAIGIGEDLGSVEPGKLADLIIVDGDPLHRIQDAMKVRKTIKNGIVYPVREWVDGNDE